MTVVHEKNNLGDLLKYESPNLYSREEVDIDNPIELGTIVSKKGDIVTKLTPTTDVHGVLISSENKKAVVIVRDAVVSDHTLIWPDNITTDQKKKAIDQLKSLGIVIRKGV